MNRRLLLAAPLAVLLQALAHAQEPERAPFVTTPSDVVEEMLRFAATGPADELSERGEGVPCIHSRSFIHTPSAAPTSARGPKQ